jgi:hypothetical protein
VWDKNRLHRRSACTNQVLVLNKPAFHDTSERRSVDVCQLIRNKKLKVQDVNEVQLDKLSLKELQELSANIDTAIRAQIRARSEMKARPPGVSHVAPPAKVDLERERDAWIAAKRSSKLISTP